MQKKVKEVNEEKEAKGPNNVTNALFVGSTADLAKLIKQQNVKSDWFFVEINITMDNEYQSAT